MRKWTLWPAATPQLQARATGKAVCLSKAGVHCWPPPYAKGTQVPPAVKDELDGGPQVLDELGRKKARLDQEEQKDLAETAVESEAVDAEQAESVEATAAAGNGTPDPDMADGQEGEVAPASKDTSDADTVDQETRNSGARGLRASGRIRITPPPSGSSMFTGQDLHIVGSIDIDADIDPDGYVTIQEAPFRLHAIEVED